MRKGYNCYPEQTVASEPVSSEVEKAVLGLAIGRLEGITVRVAGSVFAYTSMNRAAVLLDLILRGDQTSSASSEKEWDMEGMEVNIFDPSSGRLNAVYVWRDSLHVQPRKQR